MNFLMRPEDFGPIFKDIKRYKFKFKDINLKI